MSQPIDGILVLVIKILQKLNTLVTIFDFTEICHFWSSTSACPMTEMLFLKPTFFFYLFWIVLSLTEICLLRILYCMTEIFLWNNPFSFDRNNIYITEIILKKKNLVLVLHLPNCRNISVEKKWFFSTIMHPVRKKCRKAG